MRRMAFAGLSALIQDGSKTVTRRRGWLHLRPGDLVRAVRANYSNGPTLAILRVESVRREPLRAITRADIAAEGFAGLTRPEFLAMFARDFGCGPDDIVTRIAFTYVHDDEAFVLDGCQP